nr:D-alanyl-D-alanine carboxypeptidase family protein [Roseicitreum antarcticum]
MVVDARSGEILYARNHDTRLHPASLTKMMTLYVVFQAIEHGEITLDTMVTISRNAAAEPPSKLGLRSGQRIALRYLIRAAAVRSANDAATALGEAISGSEEAFTTRMTQTARAMGMSNTTFRNAHGLTTSGHLSTARDMTTLGRQLLFDYPQYYNLFSRRSADAGMAQVPNTNRRFLDAYRGADGIKTGYTSAAGFNMVGSAERNGVRIITTVFGGASTAARNAQVAELMDMGFSRAPARAATRPPATPSYSAPSAGVAMAQAGSDNQGAGRTIRLQTAVARSPRPMGRPTAEPAPEMLMALQSGISDALSVVADAATVEVVPVDTELAALAPEVLGIVPVARPDLEAAEVAQIQDGAQVQVAAVAAGAAEPTAVAEAAPQAVRATPAAAAADLDLARAAGFRVANPADVAALNAVQESPAAAAPDSPALNDQIILTSSAPVALSVAPPPRPAYVQAVAAADQAPTATQVVARMSTSDARLWGVHLGGHPNRHEAERTLIQTSLSESAALEGGIRRIQQRAGKFDAEFAGLTQDQADLACRRIQARNRTCITIAP